MEFEGSVAMIPWRLWKVLGRVTGHLRDPGPARHRAFALRFERVEGRVLLSVFGRDERRPVLETTTFPYSAVVYVEQDTRGPGVGFGTGALLDPLHVLTAAHVVSDVFRDGTPR